MFKRDKISKESNNNNNNYVPTGYEFTDNLLDQGNLNDIITDIYLNHKHKDFFQKQFPNFETFSEAFINARRGLQDSPRLQSNIDAILDRVVIDNHNNNFKTKNKNLLQKNELGNNNIDPPFINNNNLGINNDVNAGEYETNLLRQNGINSNLNNNNNLGINNDVNPGEYETNLLRQNGINSNLNNGIKSNLLETKKNFFGTRNIYEDGTNDFDWNTDNINMLLSGVQTGSNLLDSYNKNKLARKAFEFEKNAYNENLLNSKKSYNTNLENIIQSKYRLEGKSRKDANNYFNKHKL